MEKKFKKAIKTWVFDFGKDPSCFNSIKYFWGEAAKCAGFVVEEEESSMEQSNKFSFNKKI